MTGSTGVSALHLCHGKMFGTFSGREYVVVTIRAFKDACMELVAEQRRPGLFDIKNYFFGRFVAATAIPFDGKSEIIIMAGSA